MLPTFLAHELDYELPEASIAQAPLAERDGARLLCLPAGGEVLLDRAVRELAELLPPSSLLVLNDTRVIPARLFGHKPSGGRVELLLVERLSAIGPTERWRAMGRASKGLRPGERIALGDGALVATILANAERMLEVELTASSQSATHAIERIGAMPLPPYIKRAAEAADSSRYQTVFAAQPGAVAAPTAGLHFTPALLERLRVAGHQLAYVTLHVGPGTFAPLRSDDLREHVMHEERFIVPPETSAAIASARAAGRKVVAVGTTVVRTLESVADEAGNVAAGPGATSIFIYPPYRFRVIDVLLTNFHLPRSTLLALVMAFAGVERTRAAYAHAIASGYRFYSYGDAMLIDGLIGGASIP
jgi:S-adenosylmethionine:tRNA ribosyltransferase-isomerase